MATACMRKSHRLWCDDLLIMMFLACSWWVLTGRAALMTGRSFVSCDDAGCMAPVREATHRGHRGWSRDNLQGPQPQQPCHHLPMSRPPPSGTASTHELQLGSIIPFHNSAPGPCIMTPGQNMGHASGDFWRDVYKPQGELKFVSRGTAFMLMVSARSQSPLPPLSYQINISINVLPR